MNKKCASCHWEEGHHGATYGLRAATLSIIDGLMHLGLRPKAWAPKPRTRLRSPCPGYSRYGVILSTVTAECMELASPPLCSSLGSLSFQPDFSAYQKSSGSSMRSRLKAMLFECRHAIGPNKLVVFLGAEHSKCGTPHPLLLHAPVRYYDRVRCVDLAAWH